MSRCFAALFAFLVLVGLGGSILACAWDSETLEQERSRFPTVLELVTGKFPRHTPEFYHWRGKERTRRLEEHPDDPALYDDLAMSHEKLGDHQRAIELMLEKEAKFPGKYETAANLGTFYIHDGQFDKGLDELKRAIAINPDAHFGREVYQQRLVEYVLARQVDGKTVLPLGDEVKESDENTDGFDEFLLTTDYQNSTMEQRDEELQKAVKGVLGMMRFGNYDSPILLEALGDLLLARTPGPSDAKQLAARAYLKASYEVDDPAARAAYRQRAKNAVYMQRDVELNTLERQFHQELAEADAWHAQLRADELRWIAEGKNPEQEFAAKYYADPEQSHAAEPLTAKLSLLAVVAAVGVFVVLSLLFVLLLRGRRVAGSTSKPARKQPAGKQFVDGEGVV